MKVGKAAAVLTIALAASACSQGSSDNVMSPQGNALQPADINAALGPEVMNTPDMNVSSNEAMANETNSTGVPNINDEPDEPGTPTNNSAR